MESFFGIDGKVAGVDRSGVVGGVLVPKWDGGYADEVFGWGGVGGEGQAQKDYEIRFIHELNVLLGLWEEYYKNEKNLILESLDENRGQMGLMYRVMGIFGVRERFILYLVEI